MTLRRKLLPPRWYRRTTCSVRPSTSSSLSCSLRVVVVAAAAAVDVDPSGVASKMSLRQRTH
jgi:hypothetical protein